MEAKQAKRKAEELMAVDPSVFQYDEVIDDIKAESGMEVTSSQVHADAMTQKKRTGLTVRVGSEAVATGNKRLAKYTDKVMIAVDRRRVEQQMVEDRALKKEKNARADAEVFVTQGFKEELKRRKKFEEELEAQDARDEARAAEKQENGLGFASMYRNMLNGGLATSRGGEKIKEQAKAYEDLKQEEVKQDERITRMTGGVKKEEEDVKDEIAKEEAKEEVEEKKEHGLMDVVEQEDSAADAADTAEAAEKRRQEKAEEERKEKEQREEKTMSAKERFLARKKAAAQAATA